MDLENEYPKEQLNQAQVIAIIGSKAAGKDELVQYLVRHHGVMAIDVGAFARKLEEEAAEDEPHLQYDTSAKNMADYGAEFIINQLVTEVMKKGLPQTSSLLITGVRTPAEVAALKSHFGTNLCVTYIKVGDQTTRYVRTQNRDFTTDPNDFQEFVEQDDRLKSDYALAETAVLADITLWNNTSLEAYYQQIESVLVPRLVLQS